MACREKNETTRPAPGHALSHSHTPMPQKKASRVAASRAGRMAWRMLSRWDKAQYRQANTAEISRRGRAAFLH